MKVMRFTIITPCFDRPDFLEETIRSVVGQKGAFEIEYIVQDGGSDPTVFEILERWKNKIDSGSFEASCTSLSFDYYVEPDSGMYDAINCGFGKSSGDIMAWINSDDIFFPGAFDTIQQIMAENADIEWLVGRTACLNASDAVIFTDRHQKAVSRQFVKQGYYRTDLPFFNWLPQDSIFWRKTLWEKAGPLDTANRLVSDFKLWQAFAEFADPVKVDSLIGAFRYHGQQLTGDPEAYKGELGPPPRLPLGLKLACGLGWLIPQLARFSRKVPASYLLLWFFGLSKSEVLGRTCNWDFVRSRWTIIKRSVI
jgi:hypothetical protein